MHYERVERERERESREIERERDRERERESMRSIDEGADIHRHGHTPTAHRPHTKCLAEERPVRPCDLALLSPR